MVEQRINHEGLILCSTICVHSATRHNIHMYQYPPMLTLYLVNNPHIFHKTLFIGIAPSLYAVDPDLHFHMIIKLLCCDSVIACSYDRRGRHFAYILLQEEIILLPFAPFPLLAAGAPFPPHDFKTTVPFISVQRICTFPALPPLPKK